MHGSRCYVKVRLSRAAQASNMIFTYSSKRLAGGTVGQRLEMPELLAGGSCSGQGVGLPVAGQANVFRGKGCGMGRVMVENWVLWWPAKWPECKPDSADTFRSGRQYHTTTTTKTTQDSCRAPLPSAQMYMQSFLRESSEVGQVKA